MYRRQDDLNNEILIHLILKIIFKYLAGSTKNTKSFNSLKPNGNSTNNMSTNKQELLFLEDIK